MHWKSFMTSYWKYSIVSYYFFTFPTFWIILWYTLDIFKFYMSIFNTSCIIFLYIFFVSISIWYYVTSCFTNNTPNPVGSKMSNFIWQFSVYGSITKLKRQFELSFEVKVATLLIFIAYITPKFYERLWAFLFLTI